MSNQPSNQKLTKEQALRELAKVRLAFQALESGAVSLMDEKDFAKFMRWLD